MVKRQSNTKTKTNTNLNQGKRNNKTGYAKNAVKSNNTNTITTDFKNNSLSNTKKTPKKESPKVEKKEEKSQKGEGEGEYIHFKSPKYFNYARKLSKLSSSEVLKQIDKYNLNLQEKIHTGNLLSNLSSKVCQQGQYTKTKIALYKDLNKYHDLYDQCMNKKRIDLQNICILNEMPKSAKKDILSERVADGLLLGKIPKCPGCKGGRLRFNNQTGTYFCPGYIDGGYFYTDLGDDYIFCNRVFQYEEIKRETFIEK